jgi:hypothetical protein
MCLSAETTIQSTHSSEAAIPRNYRRLFIDRNSGEDLFDCKTVEVGESIDVEKQKANPNFPKLVELDWVVFDLKKQQVIADRTVFVDPGVPI